MSRAHSASRSYRTASAGDAPLSPVSFRVGEGINGWGPTAPRMEKALQIYP